MRMIRLDRRSFIVRQEESAAIFAVAGEIKTANTVGVLVESHRSVTLILAHTEGQQICLDPPPFLFPNRIDYQRVSNVNAFL